MVVLEHMLVIGAWVAISCVDVTHQQAHAGQRAVLVWL